MSAFVGGVLDTTVWVSERVVPLNALVAKVLDRVVPKSTANARGPICGSLAGYVICYRSECHRDYAYYPECGSCNYYANNVDYAFDYDHCYAPVGSCVDCCCTH